MRHVLLLLRGITSCSSRRATMAFLNKSGNREDSAFSGQFSLIYFLMADTDDPVFSSSSPMAFKIISLVLGAEGPASSLAAGFFSLALAVLVVALGAFLATFFFLGASLVSPSSSASSAVSPPSSSAEASASDSVSFLDFFFGDSTSSSVSSASDTEAFAAFFPAALAGALAPFLPFVV